MKAEIFLEFSPPTFEIVAPSLNLQEIELRGYDDNVITVKFQIPNFIPFS